MSGAIETMREALSKHIAMLEYQLSNVNSGFEDARKSRDHYIKIAEQKVADMNRLSLRVVNLNRELNEYKSALEALADSAV